jgi:hypothetical protein
MKKTNVKAHREELVDRRAYFLGIPAAARGLREVPRPKPACVFQRIPDLGFTASGEILNFFEGSVVIQVTDVLLQLPLHQGKARK